MKVIEILLNKNTRDREISDQTQEKIDFLKQRISVYTDKIFDPKTSEAGREFLKTRIRDDYYELKSLIPSVHHIAESFEVYNTKNKEIVGGPYKTMVRARQARDKFDMKYGAYVHRIRPVDRISIKEAIHRLPLTDQDFNALKEIFDNPIPAVVADVYIQDIIIDDELNDEIASIENSNPSQDIRPIIVNWIRRVMPDQLGRFIDQKTSMRARDGQVSPIHGYDPHMYKGTNDPITGNAYGKFN